MPTRVHGKDALSQILPRNIAGPQIRRLRIQQGITQQAFAERCQRMGWTSRETLSPRWKAKCAGLRILNWRSWQRHYQYRSIYYYPNADSCEANHP